MTLLRIAELESQLQRRDARIAELESVVDKRPNFNIGHFYNLTRHALMDVNVPASCRYRLLDIAEQFEVLLNQQRDDEQHKPNIVTTMRARIANARLRGPNFTPAVSADEFEVIIDLLERHV